MLKQCTLKQIAQEIMSCLPSDVSQSNILHSDDTAMSHTAVTLIAICLIAVFHTLHTQW